LRAALLLPARTPDDDPDFLRGTGAKIRAEGVMRGGGEKNSKFEIRMQRSDLSPPSSPQQKWSSSKDLTREESGFVRFFLKGASPNPFELNRFYLEIDGRLMSLRSVLISNFEFIS
jgi:hypothetical protein